MLPSSLNTGISDTAWPALEAVGIQGASCRSCQDGLQMVCQLLHRDDATGHLVGNIHQPALLSHQVNAEHCTPRQPAVCASTSSRMSENCIVLQEGHTGKGKTQRQRHAVSGYRTKALQ